MRNNKDFNKIEKVLRRIRLLLNRVTSRYHANRLKDKHFTIISNNCWGGIVYEYFNIVKQSPTVGCYFFAEDYIKFVKNLDYYLSQKMVFIDYNRSKHKESIIEKRQTNSPIGLLGDIEIVFLHYKTPEEALEKWERRCKRINKNNLIFKFSYMNECTDDLAREFLSIKGYKKVFFSAKRICSSDDNTEIIVKGNRVTGEVYNDTFYFDKYINLVSFLNS